MTPLTSGCKGTVSALSSRDVQKRKSEKAKIFKYYESAKSYYVSATAIVIETRNNVLRNSKLNSTYAIRAMYSISHGHQQSGVYSYCRPGVKINLESGHGCTFNYFPKRSASWVSIPPRPVLVAQNSDPRYVRRLERQQLVLFRSGWRCFSDCRCCPRMKSVRHLIS